MTPPAALDMSLLAGLSPVAVSGTLKKVDALAATVVGLDAAIGDLVWVLRRDGDPVPAEVVAVAGPVAHVSPLGSLDGARPGDLVEPAGTGLRIAVGDDLVGRVVDACGRPIDDGPVLRGTSVDVHATPPNPLHRGRITEEFTTGVRAVDSMLTMAKGQRVGIFAGSGVGKSTLLGMLARGSSADRVVVALVGERGREVREFLEDDLGPEAAARTTCVVATSDEPALMRLKAAHTATRIAEHYRDQGLDVLLLMDSMTRFAMAAREIGLAAGEPPATRGYPPSVFAQLPKLLERTGPGKVGTITALYTVLVDGDDMMEPIADAARSILDGHIVLSRRLAAAGHYPTIDVLESASRLAGKVLDPTRKSQVTRLRNMMATLAEGKDLVDVGAYKPGANPDLDEALEKRAGINAFLRQPVEEVCPPAQTWNALTELVA